MKPTPAQIRRVKVNRAQWRFMREAGFQLAAYGAHDCPPNVEKVDPDRLVRWERGNILMVMRRTHIPAIQIHPGEILSKEFVEPLGHFAAVITRDQDVLTNVVIAIDQDAPQQPCGEWRAGH